MFFTNQFLDLWRLLNPPYEFARAFISATKIFPPRFSTKQEKVSGTNGTAASAASTYGILEMMAYSRASIRFEEDVEDDRALTGLAT
ncbi:MAG: hypothetical protein ACKV2Q_16670, partial [Planctomycetaceae bacterium]